MKELISATLEDMLNRDREPLNGIVDVKLMVIAAPTAKEEARAVKGRG